MTAANSTQTIGQTFSLGQVTVKNRLVKSALSEALGTTDNRVTQGLVTLYRRWAEGGMGILITGNVMVDRRALGEPNNVVIEDERDLPLLQAWAQAGTSQGTQLWMQINHPGKQSPIGLNRQNVAPSAIPFGKELANFFATPRELTHDEILEIIARFGRTAAIAKKAGFSGVQIHGAHGYLVSQFLSGKHNQRNDQWGGSAENRRRFVLAVYAEMRKQVGNDFPIGIKLNSADFQKGGFSEEESLDVIRALSDAGINMIEISGGTYEAPAMSGTKKVPVKDSTRRREAYFLEFAEKARATTKTPLMVTGGFRSLAGMNEAIESGAVDFVGLGRALAIEPDVAKRLLAGLEPRYQVKPIKTGIKMVDNMALMEVVWYSRQLRRMAHGKQPKPNESALLSFLMNAGEHGFKTFQTRRLRA
ncbi:NADH:flavin oxidoreductase/NADH oxidase family protein [Agitococcus lubricus]|uniref:2,4-dienoyl-CoA reductase-like NADH-dependent reductase (Old Yellow Enzyme family) n=1 Tax=Agitococcus lubricus TaxID=1077255 RepID=A0A2T5J2R2_9GAMM|nr:NADH:flavin oxidoreductase/NADH oxidase family protein [Agitococcus lubricus]PTQ90777.1 2,4-dienoyl-CoA reductase-like NADH-dependent reductase (Old Yellow Enzyme family) [Agitococcus lubricus]